MIEEEIQPPASPEKVEVPSIDTMVQKTAALRETIGSLVTVEALKSTGAAKVPLMPTKPNEGFFFYPMATKGRGSGKQIGGGGANGGGFGSSGKGVVRSGHYRLLKAKGMPCRSATCAPVERRGIYLYLHFFCKICKFFLGGSAPIVVEGLSL
jgi:hypothetical protein